MTMFEDLKQGLQEVDDFLGGKKAGFKVTVIEKNDFAGGRCSLIHQDGYVSRVTLSK